MSKSTRGSPQSLGSSSNSSHGSSSASMPRKLKSTSPEVRLSTGETVDFSTLRRHRLPAPQLVLKNPKRATMETLLMSMNHYSQHATSFEETEIKRKSIGKKQKRKVMRAQSDQITAETTHENPRLTALPWVTIVQDQHGLVDKSKKHETAGRRSSYYADMAMSRQSTSTAAAAQTLAEKSEHNINKYATTGKLKRPGMLMPPKDAELVISETNKYATTGKIKSKRPVSWMAYAATDLPQTTIEETMQTQVIESTSKDVTVQVEEKKAEEPWESLPVTFAPLAPPDSGPSSPERRKLTDRKQSASESSSLKSFHSTSSKNSNDVKYSPRTMARLNQWPMKESEMNFMLPGMFSPTMESLQASQESSKTIGTDMSPWSLILSSPDQNMIPMMEPLTPMHETQNVRIQIPGGQWNQWQNYNLTAEVGVTTVLDALLELAERGVVSTGGYHGLWRWTLSSVMKIPGRGQSSNVPIRHDAVLLREVQDDIAMFRLTPFDSLTASADAHESLTRKIFSRYGSVDIDDILDAADRA